MHSAWHSLKADTNDTELWKAVCGTCKKVKKVRDAAVSCFPREMFKGWESSYASVIREG